MNNVGIGPDIIHCPFYITQANHMKNVILNLMAYEYWANLRVIGVLETTENPPEKAVTLMSHILGAQHVWFNRMTNNPDPAESWPQTPVTALRHLAEKYYTNYTNWLVNLTNEELITVTTYRNLKGDGPFQNTMQDILLHLGNHSAYHRGQVIQLVKTVRDDVPATDYIVWKREG